MRLYRGASQLSRYCKFFVFFCSVSGSRTFSSFIFSRQIVYLAHADSLVLLRRSLGLQNRYLTPAGLVSARLATGLLGAATRQLLRLEQGLGPTNLVSFLAAVTMLLSVAIDGSVRPGVGRSTVVLASY
jgi:hypothetical protein